MTVRLPVLTNSQMRTFRRCGREHELSYELGYRPAVEADALRFGTLVHLGLESWWRTARNGEATRATLARCSWSAWGT